MSLKNQYLGIIKISSTGLAFIRIPWKPGKSAEGLSASGWARQDLGAEIEALTFSQELDNHGNRMVQENCSPSGKDNCRRPALHLIIHSMVKY